MFCRGKKTTSLVLKKKNAEPKGNVGNKHEHMVHVKKYYEVL